MLLYYLTRSDFSRCYALKLTCKYTIAFNCQNALIWELIYCWDLCFLHVTLLHCNTEKWKKNTFDTLILKQFSASRWTEDLGHLIAIKKYNTEVVLTDPWKSHSNSYDKDILVLCFSLLQKIEMKMIINHIYLIRFKKTFIKINLMKRLKFFLVFCLFVCFPNVIYLITPKMSITLACGMHGVLILALSTLPVYWKRFS